MLGLEQSAHYLRQTLQEYEDRDLAQKKQLYESGDALQAAQLTCSGLKDALDGKDK